MRFCSQQSGFGSFPDSHVGMPGIRDTQGSAPQCTNQRPAGTAKFSKICATTVQRIDPLVLATHPHTRPSKMDCKANPTPPPIPLFSTACGDICHTPNQIEGYTYPQNHPLGNPTTNVPRHSTSSIIPFTTAYEADHTITATLAERTSPGKTVRYDVGPTTRFRQAICLSRKRLIFSA